MTSPRPRLAGLWLPLVTPFRDGRLDECSLGRLLQHYATTPIDGLILAATTGEGMTLDDDETERLVAVTADHLARYGRDLPILFGFSGSDTRKVVKALQRTSAWPLSGYMIACPYYTRPSQDGMIAHFEALAAATSHPIVIYNIPYRTGVNLCNDAMLQLAARSNIVGVKDCSADLSQSFDLLARRGDDFAVLCGDDAFLYPLLTHGAEGGIVASAHVETQAFAEVIRLIQASDLPRALALWRTICDLPRLLFAEPSPSPIKHWLWRAGLIDSAEVRLPMLPVTDALARRIDAEMARRKDAAL